MNKIFLVLILVMFSNRSIAQYADSAVYYLGLKGGPNFATVDFSSVQRGDPVTEIKPGFQSGIIFKRIGRPHLGIQLELNYIRKGWETVESEEASTIYEIYYLEMPLMSHAYIGQGKGKVFLNLGMYANTWLSGTVSNVTAGEKNSEELEFDKDVFNQFDYGIAGGIGLSRDFNFGTLQLEGRYQFGLGNVFQPIVYTREFSRYQVFTFNLNYLFKL